jgi:hypothetical protein
VGFPFDQLPKRYRIDENGHRVLLGLSIEETFEFETLDDQAPLDETGMHGHRLARWRADNGPRKALV